MNRFSYCVYYEYNLSTVDSFFKHEKTNQEIYDLLLDFPNGLDHYLMDSTVIINCLNRFKNSISIDVSTNLTKEEFLLRFEHCLKSFDLLANKIN